MKINPQDTEAQYQWTLHKILPYSSVFDTCSQNWLLRRLEPEKLKYKNQLMLLVQETKITVICYLSGTVEFMEMHP